MFGSQGPWARTLFANLGACVRWSAYGCLRLGGVCVWWVVGWLLGGVAFIGSFFLVSLWWCFGCVGS